MLEKKSIIPCSGFRYVTINSETILEKKYFLHPLALQKLALFLMEIYKVKIIFFIWHILQKIQKKETFAKPMVISMLNKQKNTYIIIGVVASSNNKKYF